MASYKLASEKLKTGGPSGQLVPSLLTSPHGRLQAPYVNPNAANIKFTPTPIPDIVVDTTLASGAKMAQIWTDSAFAFQQRQETADADSAVLAAQSAYGDVLYGTEETEGYEAYRGADAVNKHESFTGQVRGITKETLDLLSPGAQTKALHALKQQENLFLHRGAKHKAGQQTVREEDIIQAQYAAIMRGALEVSKDPVEFDKNISIALGQLSQQFEGRPDAFKVASQSFLTDVVSKVVGAHLDVNDFDLAERYIAIGATVYGIDSIATASLIDQHATAVTQAYNAISSKEIANQRLAKVEDAKLYDFATKLAVKHNDPSFLKLISNVDDYGKAKTAFEKYNDVVTINADKKEMYGDVDKYIANPSLVFDTKDGRQVNFQDRQTLLSQVRADRNLGVEGLKRQAREMSKGILTDATVNEYGDFILAAARHKEYNMNKKMYQAIDDAVAENKDPEIALLTAQSEIFNDPRFGETWAMAKPPYIEIKGLGEHDLSNLEDEFSDTGILNQDSRLTPEVLAERYGIAREAVFDKHKVSTLFSGTFTNRQDLNAALKQILNTPLARRKLMRDLEALDQQRQRYRTMGFGPAGEAAANNKMMEDENVSTDDRSDSTVTSLLKMIGIL